ncbi:(R)-mandelonitrile lyase [Dyadobacter psychrophilus]|nr:cupin domain-containing protein [Dyadobacter psychrophilus]
MKKHILTLVLSSFFYLNSAAQSDIFPKGDPAPAENFTGRVWLKVLVANDSIFTSMMGNVTFEAGARSNWHAHPAGQVLLVTDGVGYYQEKGKQLQVISKGDVVKCLPNIDHWHGASADKPMSHISLNTNTEKGIVIWKEAVTDQEYQSLRK